MTNTETPNLVNVNHVTKIFTEGPGFGVDETVPKSEFVEAPR